ALTAAGYQTGAGQSDKREPEQQRVQVTAGPIQHQERAGDGQPQQYGIEV
ncbi:MAG: hypothetical protein H3C34_29400, partial [Caldilineaceae bacterium]|nr:hypothetical protein [Caldilineaceae bacterium]